MLTFREWSRYRYGVFSETGFSGDRFYPLTYDFGGQEKINTGCTGNSSEIVVLPANFDLDEARTQASTFDFAADDNNAIDGEHLLFVEDLDEDEKRVAQVSSISINGRNQGKVQLDRIDNRQFQGFFRIILRFMTCSVTKIISPFQTYGHTTYKYGDK